MIQDPILLVDDEPELRANLQEALTQDGYRVEVAADVAAAEALMTSRHFPVLLTDLNMPGANGFELIEAVRALDPLTLCVVITGFASLETAIQAVKLGAYDFVQKPFKLAELEAVLDRALDHASVRRQLRDYQQDLETRVLARVQELQTFHDEVRELNDLLVEAQGELEPAPILARFLDYLRRRVPSARTLVLLPGDGDRWLPQRAGAGRDPKPFTQDPPPPSALDRTLEWHGLADCPEGFLVPLRAGERVLGALCLGFPERAPFHPDDPSFILWRRQLEAALLGLRRTPSGHEAEPAAPRP